MKGREGIQVGERSLKDTEYADDAALIADEAWWPSGLSRLLSKPASASVGSNPAEGRP